MIIGTTVQTIVLILITWRTDWNKQVTSQTNVHIFAERTQSRTSYCVINVQVAMAHARVNRWLLPTAEGTNGGREAI